LCVCVCVCTYHEGIRRGRSATTDGCPRRMVDRKTMYVDPKQNKKPPIEYYIHKITDLHMYDICRIICMQELGKIDNDNHLD
jgi:hypothetical protein